jgi:LysM repeat protein
MIRRLSRVSSPRFGISLSALAGILSLAVSASAQQPAGPTDNGPSAGQSSGGQSGGQSGAAPAQNVVPQVYGVVAPPPPGEPIGGGNATESSSRPVTGDKEDTFDFGPQTGGPTSVHGGSGTGGSGGVFFSDHPHSIVVGAPAPPSGVHVVQKGETLWGICEQSLNNPYQWPRIWAYNPQIQNPHWIYPNETIRLQKNASLTAAPMVTTPEEGGGGGAVSAQQRTGMAPGTVYLRDQGFVNDDATLNWGSIVGSPNDKMYLSDTDEAYVHVGSGHDVKIGQQLTVFRPIRPVGDGQVIALQGTLRVNDWNPQTRIARAQIVETLDAIERGARVGPVPRTFEVVAPKRDTADVTAHVLTSTSNHPFFGQNSVVFIDQGSDAGLEPGNRLLVVRHGDPWRQAMLAKVSSHRIAGEREEPGVVEDTPTVANPGSLPEEVTAELRVLNVQKKSATCLIIASPREVEVGEVVVARKGY